MSYLESNEIEADVKEEYCISISDRTSEDDSSVCNSDNSDWESFGSETSSINTNLKRKYISNDYSLGSTPHEIQILPKYPECGLYRFKLSEKLYCDTPTKKTWRVLPYINKKAEIFDIAYAVWKCSAKQFMQSIIATIAKRVYSQLRKSFTMVRLTKYLSDDTISRLIVLHYFLNNNYKLKRWMAVARHKPKHLRSLLYFEETHLEANKRFLFGQICSRSSISWLKSHTKRCCTAERCNQSPCTPVIPKDMTVAQTINESCARYNHRIMPGTDLHRRMVLRYKSSKQPSKV